MIKRCLFLLEVKGKSKKTKFFLTSTIKRDYKPLIESVNNLLKENFNFEIIVTGRVSSFNSSCISANISNNFIFNHNVSYSKLYQLVDNSDYIFYYHRIINMMKNIKLKK